jgi:hypothetical protein
VLSPDAPRAEDEETSSVHRFLSLRCTIPDNGDVNSSCQSSHIVTAVSYQIPHAILPPVGGFIYLVFALDFQERAESRCERPILKYRTKEKSQANASNYDVQSEIVLSYASRNLGGICFVMSFRAFSSQGRLAMEWKRNSKRQYTTPQTLAMLYTPISQPARF